MAVALALVALVVATVTDLRGGVVPNALTASTALVGVGLSAATGSLEAHALAAVGTVAVLLGARALGHGLAGRPGLGMGDVKLGAGLALLVGWPALWAFYLAAVLGVIVGGVVWARGRFERARPVPFVPFLLGGAVAAFTVLPFARVWAWVGG